MEKNKITYSHVSCRTNNCGNKLKLLKVPKVLVGVQKCQVCGNIMKKTKITKEGYRTGLKVIDYVYKNLDLKKFHKLISSFDGSIGDFGYLLLERCVKGYDPKRIDGNSSDTNENEIIFVDCLGDLVRSGEFFLRYKKKEFEIEEYFCSDSTSCTAYVLFNQRNKKYKLIFIGFNHGSALQDQLFIKKFENKFDLKKTFKEINKLIKPYKASDFRLCAPFDTADNYVEGKNFLYKKR